MSPELEELLHSSFRLRQTLSQVLPKEAVDYIMELIAKDGAHRKYLKLIEEFEKEASSEN
jgi:hypothetical protein